VNKARTVKMLKRKGLSTKEIAQEIQLPEYMVISMLPVGEVNEAREKETKRS